MSAKTYWALGNRFHLSRSTDPLLRHFIHTPDGLHRWSYARMLRPRSFTDLACKHGRRSTAATPLSRHWFMWQIVHVLFTLLLFCGKFDNHWLFKGRTIGSLTSKIHSPTILHQNQRPTFRIYDFYCIIFIAVIFNFLGFFLLIFTAKLEREINFLSDKIGLVNRKIFVKFLQTFTFEKNSLI